MQRQFAEQFIALGLAERPLQHRGDMPSTCRVTAETSVAYFCMSVVRFSFNRFDLPLMHYRSTARARICPI
jgi:hypothetical protein